MAQRAEGFGLIASLLALLPHIFLVLLLIALIHALIVELAYREK